MNYNPFVRYTGRGPETGKAVEQGFNLNHLVRWKFSKSRAKDAAGNPYKEPPTDKPDRPCLYLKFVTGDSEYVWDNAALNIYHLLLSLSDGSMGEEQMG